MSPSTVNMLLCLSPLLYSFVLAGGAYYIGRYGSPIVLKRQKLRDRREVEAITLESDFVPED